MKVILVIFSLLTIICCSHKEKINLKPITLEFPIILEKETKIDKIRDGIYVATDLQFYNSNILVAKMKDGTVVLASSPYENLGTRRLIKWIKAHLTPKKIVAINTHFHSDGTAGNQVYHEEGVETWASQMTAKLQMTEGKKIRPLLLRNQKKPIQERIKSTRFETAKNLFDETLGKTFSFSGEKVKVYYPGEAHSPDNVIVYLPNKKTLFGGCMVKPKSLGWLKHANIQAWEQSAKNLLQFDVTHVIPGHGKWGDKSLIEKTIEVAKKAANQKHILKKSFH